MCRMNPAFHSRPHNEAMPIWEYMELEIMNWPKANEEMSLQDGGKASVGRKRLVEALNRLGGKGWEAYNMEVYQNGVKSVHLKKVKG